MMYSVQVFWCFGRFLLFFFEDEKILIDLGYLEGVQAIQCRGLHRQKIISIFYLHG